MSRFQQVDALRRGAVLVLHHHAAGADAVTQHGFGGLGHGRPRLARPDHVDVLELPQVIMAVTGLQAIALPPQLRPHGCIRVHGG